MLEVVLRRISRILITGGAGFIGSHLAHNLLLRGCRVAIVDNLYSGRREYIPTGADYINLDLARADESDVLQILETFCADAVIHLAGIHFIPHCIANPAETFLANVRSTEIIARALRNLPTQKLIAASTADVYSMTDIVHREDEPTAPSNPYGLSKVLLEDIVAEAAMTIQDLSCVALRFSNVYGPRDTNPHIIPKVIQLLQSCSPEIRVGTTGTKRDFVHVDDVVEAISLVLYHDCGKYSVFNVATGHATSIGDVVQILLNAAGDGRPVAQDRSLIRTYDRPSLTCDITKINKELQWRPRVGLEEGLTRLIRESVLELH